MAHKYTVTIEQGNEIGDDIFATYLRDGEKIAIAGRHDDLTEEISLWCCKGKLPANGTFYKF